MDPFLQTTGLGEQTKQTAVDCRWSRAEQQIICCVFSREIFRYFSLVFSGNDYGVLFSRYVGMLVKLGSYEDILLFIAFSAYSIFKYQVLTTDD
jgi:hypothetical protein